MYGNSVCRYLTRHIAQWPRIGGHRVGRATCRWPAGIRAGLIVLLLTVTLHGCRSETPPPAQTDLTVTPDRPMVILFAFSKEGEQLRAWATIRRDTIYAGRQVTEGYLGMPIVLASSGLGMANAAAMTQYLIDTYNPIGIIFTGVAGAIQETHHVGDVVIPDRWITHDNGYYGNDGLLSDSLWVGNPTSAGFTRMLDIAVDTALHRQVSRAAETIAFRFKAIAQRLPEIHVGGVGVSGNSYIDSREMRDFLDQYFKAEIVDTESSAVVQTAYAAGVPVVIVRACTHRAGDARSESDQAQLAADIEAASQNTAAVVRQFLETEW